MLDRKDEAICPGKDGEEGSIETAEVYARVQGRGRSALLGIGAESHAVAQELGLTPSAVAQWVHQAQADAASSKTGTLTTPEREELSALRREIQTLRQEREILKRAMSFFAREGTS